MKAVILAAGYATRLYPLTQNVPKCLLEVAGRSILDRLCEKLNRLEALDEIVIVTNAKFFEILSQWQKKTVSRCPIRIFNDGTVSNETRLGAIGDLGLGIRKANIASDILMLASDNLFDQDLAPFVNFAQSKNPAVTIAVYDIQDPKLAAGKFGVIEIEVGGKVKGIEEKPQNPRSSLIGMGVYHFPASSLTLVEKYLSQKNVEDAPGHYIRWLVDKLDIFSFQFLGMWYDIGDLKALEDANQRIKS